MTSGEQEPPRKRQRYSTPRQASPCRQFLLEELDLEVALRQRLASTIESRITWALVLQEALTRDLDGTHNANDYRNTALDALETIEAPCDPIFTRDVRRTQLRPVQAPATVQPPNPPTVASQSAYSTRNRGLPRTTRPPPRKLLFLRNTATFPPQIAKLACPDCSRTDFSSLQGLLNHCRLSHKREFGSHDECVQCCAVLVEGVEDQAWVAANGTEVGGITIPGLRRLFEIAVGGSTEAAPLLRSKKIELPPFTQTTTPSETIQSSPKEPTDTQSDPAHVTKTLGYHSDTPALAPFLGRAPKLRCIHSYDENEPADIFGAGSFARKKTHWRMPYTHRNTARAALDIVVDPSATTAEAAVEPTPLPGVVAAPLLRGPVTRFHMMARVSVRDLSMWIPPVRRAKPREDHTHRWRLEVSAPSYSLPLNSFLTTMTVRSVTDPPPSTLVHPITIEGPPFIVTSTTSTPFLAHITFTWAGVEGLNPPSEIEHWVELDPLRLSHAVPGDEQVFDIALDRATELLPASHEDNPPISWAVDSVGRELTTQEAQDGADEVELDYSARLRSLLPQFPLTSRDVRGLSSRRIPYTLVATLTQFRNLVYGRQKAIEWARARALRDAYEQACVEEPWADGRANIPLTAGDVFRWLEDEGQFLRKARRQVKETARVARTRPAVVKAEAEDRPSEEYCRNCGLHYVEHPGAEVPTTDGPDTVKQEPAVPNLSLFLRCSKFNNAPSLDLPVVDVSRLLSGAPCGLSPTLFAAPPSCGEDVVRAFADTRHRELLTAAEPGVVRAIQALATRSKLNRLCPPRTDVTGLDFFAADTEDAEEDGLAASAVLALAVRSFARMLMQSAAADFCRDEGGLRAAQGGVGSSTKPRRLLTPAHLVRGVLHDAPTVAGCGAVVLSMAPLGMSLPSAEPVEPEQEL